MTLSALSHGFLCPIPIKYLPIFSDIKTAELHLQETTFSTSNLSCLDPDHILCGHLHSLSEMGNLTVQWTNIKWSKEYSKNMSAIHVSTFRFSTRPMGTKSACPGHLGSNSTAYVFESDAFVCRCTKGLSPHSQSKSVVPLNRSTADYIISQCPAYRAT